MKCSGNTKSLRHRKSLSNGSKNSIISEHSLRSNSGTPKGSQKKRGSSEPFMNLRVNGNKIGWNPGSKHNLDRNV